MLLFFFILELEISNYYKYFIFKLFKNLLNFWIIKLLKSKLGIKINLNVFFKNISSPFIFLSLFVNKLVKIQKFINIISIKQFFINFIKINIHKNNVNKLKKKIVLNSIIKNRILFLKKFINKLNLQKIKYSNNIYHYRKVLFKKFNKALKIKQKINYNKRKFISNEIHYLSYHVKRKRFKLPLINFLALFDIWNKKILNNVFLFNYSNYNIINLNNDNLFNFDWKYQKELNKFFKVRLKTSYSYMNYLYFFYIFFKNIRIYKFNYKI